MTYPSPPPPGYGPMGGAPHPKATTVLIFGILGLVICGLFAPFAWQQGNAALAEVRNSNGMYAEDASLKVGRILGIIGTVLLAVGFLIFIAAISVGVMSA